MIAFFFSFHLHQTVNTVNWQNQKLFFEKKHSFIKQETVNKLLIENKQNASSTKDKLDLNKLERTLNSNDDWKIRCVCKYWWCLKSSGKTKPNS
jgi:cell division protein FtsQ